MPMTIKKTANAMCKGRDGLRIKKNPTAARVPNVHGAKGIQPTKATVDINLKKLSFNLADKTFKVILYFFFDAEKS